VLVTRSTPAVPVLSAVEASAAFCTVAGVTATATRLTDPANGMVTPAPDVRASTTCWAVTTAAVASSVITVETPETSTMEWMPPGVVAASTICTVRAPAVTPPMFA